MPAAYGTLPLRQERKTHEATSASALRSERLAGRDCARAIGCSRKHPAWPVKWLATYAPLDAFKQELLSSFGANIKVCEIRRNGALNRDGPNKCRFADWEMNCLRGSLKNGTFTFVLALPADAPLPRCCVRQTVYCVLKSILSDVITGGLRKLKNPENPLPHLISCCPISAQRRFAG